jgi:hypothetical protein
VIKPETTTGGRPPLLFPQVTVDVVATSSAFAVPLVLQALPPLPPETNLALEVTV